nr:MAG TPA: hypothetical protein [Caudoviricetes sp.]
MKEMQVTDKDLIKALKTVDKYCDQHYGHGCKECLLHKEEMCVDEIMIDMRSMPKEEDYGK